MRIVGFLILLVIVALAARAATVTAQASAPQVDVLRVDGTVNPALARYIDRGISKAEQEHVAGCLIELNTPGGLLSSTEDIVSRISRASVPIIVYVPRGGWAASAGAFITLAADVAAMGPGSVIGASTPVSSGGGQLSGDERNKAINLASHWMRSIAEEHGRNEQAAMAAVTQAASFSPGEARGVADLSQDNQKILGVTRLDPPLIDDAGAGSIDELLDRLASGMTLANGQSFKIAPKATSDYIDMTVMERFLMAINDPDIAYILLIIGMLGLLVEILHPGFILPGVLGGICLLLGIYSLGILGVNYTGLLLMILAFGLFIAEVFTSAFGLLFAGGVISLVVGSLLLFSGTPFRIDPWLIAVVVLAVSAVFVLIVIAIIRAYRLQVNTGREGLIGQTAVVRVPLEPRGTVFIEGETWNAWLDTGRAERGEEVIVTQVEGLQLKVIKKSKEEV